MSRTLRINGPDGPFTVADGGTVDLDVEELRDGNGDRITDAYVDRLSDEIETRGLGGRPSLSGRGTSQPVRARVPDSLHGRLRARMDAERRTESDVVRAALEQYLDGPAAKTAKKASRARTTTATKAAVTKTAAKKATASKGAVTKAVPAKRAARSRDNALTADDDRKQPTWRSVGRDAATGRFLRNTGSRATRTG